MDKRLKWVLAIAGLPLIGVTPFLWSWVPGLLWLACPLILVWAFWLVIEYLTWARTLGKR
jgi:hypothetical protein